MRATCFLVSQFLLEPAARTALFADIATRLFPAGILVNADLAADVRSPHYDALLSIWLNRMGSAGVPPAALDRAHAAYARDVAIFPAERIKSLIESAGF
jgi:tRNA (cmo5U34)-methyltransferase